MSNPLVYFDNSATTRPFDQAIRAAALAMEQEYFNPSAAYEQGLHTAKRIQAAREAVATLMGLNAQQVVFTAGGTEGDNMAIIGAVQGARVGKKHLLLSGIEHPAVLEAGRFLASQGHEVQWLDADANGQVTPQALAAHLREDTFLVSVMHVNNETGATNDLAALGSMVHDVAPHALFHSDGVQAFGRVPLGEGAREVDIYTVSAHKINAPKGVGAVYIKKGVKLSGMALGGGQEGGIRSGTENVPGILAFGVSAQLYAQNHAQYVQHLRALKLRLWQGVSQQLDNVFVNGPSAEGGSPHILNISFDGVRSEVLLHALEAEGVLVGMGSACSSRRVKVSAVLSAMGLATERAQAAIRFSFSPLNTMDEVEHALPIIARQVALLRRYQRR